jgi:hypothetical protein
MREGSPDPLAATILVVFSRSVRWTIMVRLIGRGLGVVALAIGTVAAAADARVAMQEGLITAYFEATPVPEALAAVQRATGVEIVVPASVRDKSLTLTIERASFEQLVRRVLDGLELGGFAVVYEATGPAQRLIVVDRARGSPTDVESAAPVEPLPTAGAGSEPVYIPPATPPVYVPPARPPVYIPPRTPPVYIPPTTPPVYTPPPSETPGLPPSQ